MPSIIITTDRTRLRLIKSADLTAIHMLHVLPETDQYNTLGIPRDIEETRATIEPWITDNIKEDSSNFTFAIEGHSDNAFIGLFGLKLFSKKYRSAEVWYKILPKYWNRGIATEVLQAMITYVFDTLKLHRIQAGCAVENIASIKVLEKVGMTREGRGKSILPLKTGWSDNYTYAILDMVRRT